MLIFFFSSVLSTTTATTIGRNNTIHVCVFRISSAMFLFSFFCSCFCCCLWMMMMMVLYTIALRLEYIGCDLLFRLKSNQSSIYDILKVSPDMPFSNVIDEKENNKSKKDFSDQFPMRVVHVPKSAPFFFNFSVVIVNGCTTM
ncbi:predicted protein [Candida tropicalis MYA-3404]|uniref:Uncharacterized protein n=1 Tax=Candida tropicalis (strain ATCC MYA-3404 / T1) TaxID=294747 RepID=C5MEC2_CANTT|nr:predicted protein [Candida tropicalis MYA-3404]EER31632.1 predicted protein [Candida tropicalis MYA-3404]KAG4405210.1 hypothetical protein JTP64_005246 [Candida tropicalis]